MERLDMRLVQEIIYRLRKGQSVHGIARDLAVSRVTVRGYRRLAEQQGLLVPEVPLPDPAAVEEAMGGAPKPPAVPSSVEPYRDLVTEWAKEGMEMVAIHQRLVRSHGYTGGYSSVKRFVHQVRPAEPKVVMRVETPPGAEAQVDFGAVGLLLDPATGKKRPAFCFVCTLSYSRHQHLEFTFDQGMPTWIRCHRNAFESFGGVVAAVVVDNLKAAVLKAQLEDPVLCTPYRRMAQHYDFLVHTCRVRTPEHKGKTESGVHYVQRNFMPVMHPDDIDQANRLAPQWVEEMAGERDHGTTHEAPLLRFRERELPALKPLPSEPFELLEVMPLLVHSDWHIRADYNFYSVPYLHVGQKVEAYLGERIVQVYQGVELLTTHPRATGRGEWVTRPEHGPADKRIYLERTPGVCRQMAAEIGEHCHCVVEAILSRRPADNLRAAQLLVGLGEKVGAERLEAACRRAIHYGEPTYRRVKHILASGMEQEVLPGLLSVPAEAPVYTHARAAAEFFPAESEGEQ
jgi:transposase